MYKKIYRSMRLVALLTLVVTSILIMSAAFTTIDSELRRELRSETKTCAAMLENYGDASEAAKKNSDVFGDKRATLISENGEVLFDSYADKSNLGDHSSRPEVAQAEKADWANQNAFPLQRQRNIIIAPCFFRTEPFFAWQARLMIFLRFL